MSPIKEFILKVCRKIIFELTIKKHPNLEDSYYLLEDVPSSNKMKHQLWLGQIIETFNRPGVEILELGSREVTGVSNTRKSFDKANYNGFDYYPGNNVDVVGDVQKLSTYFNKNFDLIFSASCFEHFAMPWDTAL